MITKAVPNFPTQGPPLPRGWAITWKRLQETAWSYASAAVYLVNPTVGNRRMLGDAVYLLYKSISVAAADATLSRGILDNWVMAIQDQVTVAGKFPKWEVLYVNLSPPPVFWDYKCLKCRWWGPTVDLAQNTCKVVAGDISPQGWCAIWVPPASYKPFTWPQQFIKGNW